MALSVTQTNGVLRHKDSLTQLEKNCITKGLLRYHHGKRTTSTRHVLKPNVLLVDFM